MLMTNKSYMCKDIYVKLIILVFFSVLTNAGLQNILIQSFVTTIAEGTGSCQYFWGKEDTEQVPHQSSGTVTATVHCCI